MKGGKAYVQSYSAVAARGARITRASIASFAILIDNRKLGK
jgi:hypothetical protein